MNNKKLIENYLSAAVILYENLQAMSGMSFPPDPDRIVEKPKCIHLQWPILIEFS